MVEGEVGQGAAVGRSQWEGRVGQEHGGAVGGVLGGVDAAPDVVGQAREPQEAEGGGGAGAAGQRMERRGEVEDGGGDAGDAALVVDAAEVRADPALEGSLDGGG